MADFTDTVFVPNPGTLFAYGFGVLDQGVADFTGIVFNMIGGTVSSTTLYRNRTYDTTVSRFVFWETASNPDTTGTSYPGPGVFGVTTTGYTLMGSYQP